MEKELVTVHVCDDIGQAYLFRSALEGSGVEAFIPDEYTLRLNVPPIAIGGVQLMVWRDDLDRARAILGAAEPRRPSNPRIRLVK